MAFHVRDPETDRVVRALAAATGASLTETIRVACDAELQKLKLAESEEEKRAQMRAVRERLAQYPQDKGVVLDKAFFDALNDE